MAEVTTSSTQTFTSPPTTLASTTDPELSYPAQTSTIVSTAENSGLLKPPSPRKRPRASESPSPGIADRSLRKSPSPKTTKPGHLLQVAALPLTAAGEMAEQKRRKIEMEKEQSQDTSPNPKRKAVEALMGIGNGLSRPADAPNKPTSTLSKPIAATTPAIPILENSQNAGSIQTSPVSVSSSGTRGSNGVSGMTANGTHVVASPGQMGEEDGHGVGLKAPPPQHDSEDTQSTKAFSYPGPLLSAQLDSRRGMSLPGSSLARDDSKSPASNKKHKCPYCSTEFTRHHNLKSHLLTHSHEKPYLCQTCDSRFRRLHDLKRHTKLHTGERPHICPKCKRSFARGDALARHNKGQGGCAGRRSSVGSFGGEGTPGGDETMEGMVYTNEASHEPENMDEDTDGPEDRGTSVPSIRRHDAPSDQPYRAETQPTYQRQPSTYPPVAARAPMGGTLHPPTTSHAGSNTSTSLGSQPSPLSYPPTTTFPPSSVFAPQQPMTESPQPLSAGDPRNRSPSLSAQLSAHSYSRRTHTRSSPPPLPPPPAHSNAPQLPSLPGLTPPDPRFTLHSTPASHGPVSSLPHPQRQSSSYPGVGPGSAGGFQSSASNSLSSHGTAAHGSGDRMMMQSALEERMWAAVKDLEAKVENLQDEVRGLRAQLQQQQQPSHQTQSQSQAPPSGR